MALSADEAAAAVDALVGNVFAHTPVDTPYGGAGGGGHLAIDRSPLGGARVSLVVPLAAR